jgi:poly(ADP-ribose) glycohydrolase
MRTAGGRVVCTYFLSATCRLGARCQYAHELPAGSVAASSLDAFPTSFAPATSEHSKERPICTYFHGPRGVCSKGDRCPCKHLNDWRHDVVRAPWSEGNLATNRETGTTFAMWARISAVLDPAQYSVTTPSELEELLISVLPPGAEAHGITTEFESLLHTIQYGMDAAAQKQFFDRVLPRMRRTVLDCPSLFAPGSLKLLKQSTPGVVRFDDRQVFALLCCCFFSLFPYRHRFRDKSSAWTEQEQQKYAARLTNCNFSFLFGFGGANTRHKIRCLLAYFAAKVEELDSASPPPATVIEIVRHVVAAPPNLRDCKLPIIKDVRVLDQGLIEDSTGLLEVDFANRMLGGGVIGRGCVQEEIRFVISPEMFVSRLVCEQLLPTEAVYINGVRQFCDYEGYAATFTFAGRRPYPTVPPRRLPDGALMHDISIVAMDATNYNQSNLRPEYQYLPSWIERDLGKAAIAFAGSPLCSLASANSGAVATGNWGCGAFGGDLELKFLQQLCAASVVRRPLVYYTFGKPELHESIVAAHQMMIDAGMRVCDLYCSLLDYQKERFVAAPVPTSVPDPAEDALARHSTMEYDADIAMFDAISPPPPPTTRSVLQHLAREIGGEV